MKSYLTMATCVIVALQCAAEDVHIDVNVDVKHSVGGISTFDRSKFITIHAETDKKEWISDNLDDEGNDVSGLGKGKMFSDNFFSEFLEGYDVYLGRSTGGIKWALNDVATEDPERPGFADPAVIESQGQNSRNSFKNDSYYDIVRTLRSRHENWILGNQHNYIWPDGWLTKNGWAISTADTEEEPFGTAAGEFSGRYINEYFSSSYEEEPPPKYFEVVNEPLWELINQAEVALEDQPPIISQLSKFHNTVADQVRAFNTNHPDVKIGGFTTAFPDFEKDDFQRWEIRWKSFIDQTAHNMDFWSIHLYDHPVKGEREYYRRGSNMEATMDMMQHYSQIALNKTTPLVVSEYGAQTHNYNNKPWNAYCDWLKIKSTSSMMMSYMERPHEVDSALPFLVLKAEWGRQSDTVPHKSRLLRQRYEKDGLTGDPVEDYTWVYADVVKFYQLWSDVNGTRVDSKSYDLDVMTDAYVDGNKMYVVASNLDFESKTIRLNTMGHEGNQIQSVRIKHLFLDETPAVLEDHFATIEETDYTDFIPQSVELKKEATMIIEYTFANDVVIDNTSDENRYYADQYYKPIVAETPENFTISNVTTAGTGEAILRIGVGRDHGQTVFPKVTFNGTDLVVPNNFRGEPQYDRDRFFGVLEIPVPYGLIIDNNTVSIEYLESGGHISSVVLQTFAFSKQVRSAEGTQISAPEYSLIEEGRYIHFSADEGVETDESGNVVQLRNLASDRVFTPSGTGAPVLTVRTEDSLPVLRFDGDTYIQLDNAEKFNSGSTVFAVFNRDVSQIDGGEDQRIYSSAFDGFSQDWTNNGINLSTNADVGELTRDIYTKSISLSSFKNANIGVYANSDSSQYLKGDLAEFILYDRELSDAEITQVEEYLNAKWISTDSITHTFNVGDHGTIEVAYQSQSIKRGESPEIPIVTAHTGWDHVGWDSTTDSETGNVDYTAVYSAAVYTVTFDAGEEGTISSNAVQNIEHGLAADAPVVTPIDAYTTHTGWDELFDTVTGDLTVRAQYSFAVPDGDKPPAADDLYLWLDAGLRVMNSGGAVTEWMNLVGDLDYLAASGSEDPQLVTRADGKPVVRFNGASYFQFDDDTISKGPVSVFAVFNRDSGQVSTDEWQRIFSSYDDSSEDGTDKTGDGLSVRLGTDVSESPRAIYTSTGATSALDNVSIGVSSIAENNQFLHGDIAELLVYRSNTIDTDAVKEYLKTKWFSYTVTFDEGLHGSIELAEQVQTVGYNAMPSIPSVTADSGWNHVGWNTAVSVATGDVAYTAQYEEDLQSQSVTLKTGFNFVSLTVLPEVDKAVSSVLSSVEAEVDYVENMEGLISSYDGNAWNNGIGEWNAIEGYLIKMKNPIQLSVVGKTVVLPPSLELGEGTHLIPAVHNAAVLTYFSSIENEIEYIRDDEGNVVRKVDESWVLGFENVEAGRSYLIKLKDLGVFSFP